VWSETSVDANQQTVQQRKHTMASY
jgi:hypothetical protein